MTRKMSIGRICEYLVQTIVEYKSGYSVANLNDIKTNHPVTDLIVTDSLDELSYEISVKAKEDSSWPRVKGINKKNQYMVFVDLNTDGDPSFYILSNRQWQNVLKKILPNRKEGGEIINGAIEWNWEVDGKKKKHRGSVLKIEDIERYKDNWSVLPGVE